MTRMWMVCGESAGHFGKHFSCFAYNAEFGVWKQTRPV